MLVCVCYGDCYSVTDLMIHIVSKNVTGVKINKYWKLKKVGFPPPPALSLIRIFLLFVSKGLCCLWSDSLGAQSCHCFNLNGWVFFCGHHFCVNRFSLVKKVLQFVNRIILHEVKIMLLQIIFFVVMILNTLPENEPVFEFLSI